MKRFLLFIVFTGLAFDVGRADPPLDIVSDVPAPQIPDVNIQPGEDQGNILASDRVVSGPEKDRTTSLPDLAIRKSLARVRISGVRYDYTRPWQRTTANSFTVTGIVLPGKIAVLAGDVRNAAFIEVSSYRSYDRYEAEVAYIDREVNLALLTVDEEFFDGMLPLPIASDPAPGDQLTAIRSDDVFRIFRENVTVSELRTVSDLGNSHLPSMVFRTGDSFRSGGLVLCEDKLCGMIGYSDSDRRAESIPGSILRAYLSRAPRNSGFVCQGFEMEALTDPVLKSHLGLSEDIRGVYISRVLPYSTAYNQLEAGDVLISVDGKSVDETGLYDDPVSGRTDARLLFAINHYRHPRLPGASIPVEVYRNSEHLQLDIELRRCSGERQRIPWSAGYYDDLPSGMPGFVIENGLVFLELTVSFLQERLGGNWRNSILEYTYLYDTMRFYDRPADDRIIVLSSIYPDPVNQGYEKLGTARVVRLAEESPNNLRHMRGIIRAAYERGDAFLPVEFSDGRTIYLDLENRQQVNDRIRSRYNLPADSAWDMDHD